MSNCSILVSNELDFVLDHFSNPLFPRKIMTLATHGQIEVFDKQSVIECFSKASYRDCRINAYPSNSKNSPVPEIYPTFFMVDLDLKDFVSRLALNLELSRCLKKIERIITGNPTVLWTGNGYHIYQPLETIDLENFQFLEPLKKYFHHDLISLFMQFAEWYFSKRADKNHVSTVQSCLVRIPATLNTKHAVRGKFREVTVIQRWNGLRAKTDKLIHPFHTYLIDKKIKRLELRTSCYFSVPSRSVMPNQIKWIERLLETPISDFRKNAVSLILAPYLVNNRQFSFNESFTIIMNWLKNKCDVQRNLDFNAKTLVRNSLIYAEKMDYRPLMPETLKQKNIDLYFTLFNQ